MAARILHVSMAQPAIQLESNMTNSEWQHFFVLGATNRQKGRRGFRVFLCVLFVMGWCYPANCQPGATTVSRDNPSKRITVEGWVVNRKGGAQLVGTDFKLWIGGLAMWPNGYYSSGNKGKRVRVTGVLAEDHALPVFIPEEGEPPRQGIPVSEGTDMEKASHRYLLKDAGWELVR